MPGSTDQEIGAMVKVENEQKRREQIMRERASKDTVKIGTSRMLLQRLSSDPAIKHIMLTHQFSVGLLTELAPHEHPDLLGLNENAGQTIKLRLRTDQYDDFRSYNDIRRVLCHELTHNVWGDHDDNFKELNSKLNREVGEFERRTRDGAHTLTSYGSVYEPPTSIEAEVEVEAGAHVLGGSEPSPSASETIEERRHRMLHATLSRLREQEQEIEQSCGTTPASQTH